MERTATSPMQFRTTGARRALSKQLQDLLLSPQAEYCNRGPQSAQTRQQPPAGLQSKVQQDRSTPQGMTANSGCRESGRVFKEFY